MNIDIFGIPALVLVLGVVGFLVKYYPVLKKISELTPWKGDDKALSVGEKVYNHVKDYVQVDLDKQREALKEELREEFGDRAKPGGKAE